MAIFKVIDKKYPETIFLACQNRGLNFDEMKRLLHGNCAVNSTDKDGNYEYSLPGSLIVRRWDWVLTLDNSFNMENTFIVEPESFTDYVLLGEYFIVDTPVTGVKSLAQKTHEHLLNNSPSLRQQMVQTVLMATGNAIDWEMLKEESEIEERVEDLCNLCIYIADHLLFCVRETPNKSKIEVPDPVEQMEKLEFGENVLPGGS